MKEVVSKHSIVISFVIILLAGIIAIAMIQSKKLPQRMEVEKYQQKVSVQLAHKQELAMPIFSQGVVEPRTKIRLLPEVAGEIIKVSPKWENGGFFRQGEVFLEIEDYNYQNQLAKAEANVARSQSSLTQEEGLAFVARQDWERRNTKTDNAAAKALALREPQLAAAVSQVDAAKADVVSAQRSLEKTKITAPFDGILLKKSADIGQYIAAGQILAEYYSVDVAEVRVPLTEAQLIFLDVARIDKKMKIPVEISYSVENETIHLQGHLSRTEGLLDALTKVLYAVIEIQDPYALKNEAAVPLRLGSFVEVSIKGKNLQNIFVLPRRSLRAGNKVWVVNAKNILELRAVKLLPLRENDIYIYAGLSENEQVVVGGLIDPIEGKRVVPVLKEPQVKLEENN